MSLTTLLQPGLTFTTVLAVAPAGGSGLTPAGSVNTELSGSLSAQVALINTGLQGPRGEPGPGATFHNHLQASASDAWVVNHNLGRLVSVTVLNAGGQEVEAEVIQTSENQARVYFNLPQTGKVLVR